VFGRHSSLSIRLRGSASIKTFYLSLLLLLITLIGLAFHYQQQPSLQTYIERLANVLDIAPLEINFSNNQLSSPLASFKQDVPRLSISILELGQLQHCDLGQLIAERNSTLGKLEESSRRFFYEVKLLKAIDECIAITDSKTIRDKLIQYKQQKLQLLPEQFNNLILLSSEITKSFHRDAKMLTSNESFTNTYTAIEKLLRVKQHVNSRAYNNIDLKLLDQQLRQLETFPLVSQLKNTVHYHANNLPRVTSWLSASLSNNDFCAGSLYSKRQILINVMNQFFIEKIQRESTEILKALYLITPLLSQLYTDNQSLNPLPPRLTDKFNLAFANHIQVWLPLVQCEN
jgi:hypothetical protein